MSVDRDLLDELGDAASAIPGLRRLSDADAVGLQALVGESFVRDTACVWWWTSIHGPSKSVDYGDADGLEVLAELVEPDSQAVLFVTDDEPGPWPAVRGRVGDLMAMLGEMRVFEFFLVDPDRKWIVFDTHENRLVLAGSLIDKVSS